MRRYGTQSRPLVGRQHGAADIPDWRSQLCEYCIGWQHRAARESPRIFGGPFWQSRPPSFGPRALGPRAVPPLREIAMIDPRVRLAAKTRREGDCILWLGTKDQNGYGQMFANGRLTRVHRLAYQWAKGPIPKGYEIDHLCRTRACVNPEHLEAVTRRTNVLRSLNQAAFQAQQTHCLRGHPLSGQNLYITPDARRQCRTCRAAADRKAWQRKLLRRANAV